MQIETEVRAVGGKKKQKTLQEVFFFPLLIDHTFQQLKGYENLTEFLMSF